MFVHKILVKLAWKIYFIAIWLKKGNSLITQPKSHNAHRQCEIDAQVKETSGTRKEKGRNNNRQLNQRLRTKNRAKLDNEEERMSKLLGLIFGFR